MAYYESYESKRKRELTEQLQAMLTAAGLPETFMETLIDLVEVIADEKCSDVYDRVNKSGRYDPDY
jgi:hypothetical protein